MSCDNLLASLFYKLKPTKKNGTKRKATLADPPRIEYPCDQESLLRELDKTKSEGVFGEAYST